MKRVILVLLVLLSLPALLHIYQPPLRLGAALFALGVSRRLAPGIITVTGGGWIASGPAGADRPPIPTYPPGLSLLAAEGAGTRVDMGETPVAGVGKWLNNPASEALLTRRNTESLARLAAIAERRTKPKE